MVKNIDLMGKAGKEDRSRGGSEALLISATHCMI